MNGSDIPLDWTFLNSLADEDQAFARELLQIYYKDSQAQLQKLAQAIETQDFGAVYTTAHYLVGSSRNVGAINIAACAKTLEKLALSKTIDSAVDLFHNIETDFRKIERWLYEHS